VEVVGDEDDARRHQGDRDHPQAASRAAAAPPLHHARSISKPLPFNYDDVVVRRR
jgi:hypothetical protein